ncbi:MAG: efflux RND transporter periplasmic adaptor subunit [Vicinamibacterales bacterium]
MSVVALSVLTLAVAGCQRMSAAPKSGNGRGRGGAGGGGGAAPVAVAAVTQRDVPIDIEAIGNVEAANTIAVRSQVTGTVVETHFKEGDSVKAGQDLFTIDTRPYLAALQQAQATMTRDEALQAQADAQLGRDQAQASYARVTAEHNAQLLERGIVSKDAYEQAKAAADAADALVKADAASVQSARAQLDAQSAAVDNAKVALSYTTIISPIDGRSGAILVKKGNLATANTTELTTIAQVQPVYLTFSVPAGRLPAIQQGMRSGALTVTASPEAGLGEGVVGTLAFVDNAVDPSTDTIKLKAQFANTDAQLWPGAFVRVSLRVGALDGAIVAPAQAVQTGQDGPFVFVVKPDQTVDQRSVTVGERAGQDIVIESGLSVGETVVTEGQLRLEPGARVQVGGSPDGRAASGGQSSNGRSGRGQGRRASTSAQ